MTPLSEEKKQAGGKHLPPNASPGGGGGVSLDEISRSRKRNRDILLGTWNMDLQEVAGVRGDWMELAQDRVRWRELVGTVRNLRVP
jgi:hypothetical protein